MRSSGTDVFYRPWSGYVLPRPVNYSQGRKPAHFTLNYGGQSVSSILTQRETGKEELAKIQKEKEKLVARFNQKKESRLQAQMELEKEKEIKPGLGTAIKLERESPLVEEVVWGKVGGLSVQEICRVVGVSKPTLYNYIQQSHKGN